MLFSIHYSNLHQALAQLHGGGHGLLQPLLNPGLDQQAVNHHFNRVVLAFIKLDFIQFFVQMAKFAVNARAHKTVLRQLGQFFFEFAFASAHQRRHDHDAIFGFQLHHALHNLVRRLAADRFPHCGQCGTPTEA